MWSGNLISTNLIKAGVVILDHMKPVQTNDIKSKGWHARVDTYRHMNLAKKKKQQKIHTQKHKRSSVTKTIKVSFPNETFAEVLSDPLLLRQYIYTHE